MDFSKPYNPIEIEDKIYQLWESSGFFNPDKLPGKRKKSYCLLLPPPNVTGELHMGHACNALIQDSLIRKKRMEGFKTLWLPGTDHAGIATQNVVEKKLRKEGKTRFDLGREEFLKQVWQWKEEYGNIILNQLKKLGASCDWSRTAFTMDENYGQAIKDVFSHYYKKGLIYQKEKPINWCPRCQTSLSDLELEYKEQNGTLYFIKYPLKSQNFISVATTRPETMLGDTAIAVNPNDKRYKDLIGQIAVLPIASREIPIISDKMVDTEFGTGAVKITPAHDLKDYETSLRHNLAVIKVINEIGKIIEPAPSEYQGLKTLEAREKIVVELKNLGLLEKEEPYLNSAPCCYRCNSIVETIPSKQWFLKMDGLAKKALKAVKKGKIKFYPQSFSKLYFNWLENIRDWCISRQIWWGHKIPIDGETDVLDTWFSSALWPFATLKWPQKTSDLKNFYPSDVLVTARDIINLWVARMIFSGQEFMGKNPFPKVFIHPTILNKSGQRMSKSLGTGINPLDLVKNFGADAVRFGIAWQLTGLQDVRFDEQTIVSGKKFCNKMWNATRFVLTQTESSKLKTQNAKLQLKNKNLTQADKKILEELKNIIKSTDKDMENFRFGQAIQNLYHFFWHEFCDIYIEESKKNLNKDALFYILFTSLKLLHPFMPFITEEIYQQLPLENKKECLMIEEWPASNARPARNASHSDAGGRSFAGWPK